MNVFEQIKTIAAQAHTHPQILMKTPLGSAVRSAAGYARRLRSFHNSLISQGFRWDNRQARELRQEVGKFESEALRGLETLRSVALEAAQF